jgi:hypothetical protein
VERVVLVVWRRRLEASSEGCCLREGSGKEIGKDASVREVDPPMPRKGIESIKVLWMLFSFKSVLG